MNESELFNSSSQSTDSLIPDPLVDEVDIKLDFSTDSDGTEQEVDLDCTAENVEALEGMRFQYMCRNMV